MKRIRVKKREVRRHPREYGRMAHLLLMMAFVVGLGLAHIHLRLATRDMEIQRCQLQTTWEDLWDERASLEANVAQLRGGDRILDYAQNKLGLVELAAERIQVWTMPRTIVDGYDRAFSDVALARARVEEIGEDEPLVARLIGAVLSPDVQAQPANAER